MSDNLKDIKILKEILPPHRTIYGCSFFHDKKITGTKNIQKLKHFADCVKAGMLPDGVVLEEMANNIEEYLSGNKMTLDKAFGLMAKTKSGNAAMQYKSEKKLSEIVLDSFYYYAEQKKKSYEKAVEAALDLHESDMTVDAIMQAIKRKYPDKRKFIESIEQRKKLDK